MYFVYALYSRHFDKIYIGYSEDPDKRLSSHNHPNNKGWTKKYQPWEIVYTVHRKDPSLRERKLAFLVHSPGKV